MCQKNDSDVVSSDLRQDGRLDYYWKSLSVLFFLVIFSFFSPVVCLCVVLCFVYLLFCCLWGLFLFCFLQFKSVI